MNSLIETRKQKGLSQTRLGKLTNVPQSNISKIERGLVGCNNTTKQRIESVLGKIDWIANDRVRLNGSYSEAERLVKQLVGMTLEMDKSERGAITKLIRKYFK